MVKLTYNSLFFKQMWLLEGNPWQPKLTDINDSYYANANSDFFENTAYHIINHDIGPNALVNQICEEFTELMDMDDND